ncbi:MAG: nicotinate-nucleotide--dimethylbenzimidazole phosphoribosyltransferase [Syntrophales bacterium]|nr:nicotinate-nucleotide--dimethylbenzimidazole phosphoribosyltransferase [Syntrophales bacterium]MDD5233718.1 nicotinate-nucleotide--dimethylbenzimidazole phosphoribosyltransferase [Syntrophales bacterium]
MTELGSILKRIDPADAASRRKAEERLGQLTMPFWALGRLMDLAVDLAGITRSLKPPVARKAVVVMAGDHGVTAESVSRYPREVTVQMVHNIVNGGAGINALARLGGVRVAVVDMGVAGDLEDLAGKGKIIGRKIGRGTGNLLREPAMTREEAVRALEAGIETALDMAGETDVFGTGDMGIGNTTPSGAIISVFSGRRAEDIAGHGTGLDEEQRRHKTDVIERALILHRPDPADPVGVLQKVGGYEIGGIAGLILGAAAERKPVLVDGFISTAGALIACALSPTAADYVIASHRSMEKGHRIALETLGKMPLLDLDMRLGEGTGAVLAMHLLEAAARIMTEVATFEEAMVSREA